VVAWRLLVSVAHATPSRLCGFTGPPGRGDTSASERYDVGSVIKKRRKRMAKKKHRKLLKKTRVARRKLGK